MKQKTLTLKRKVLVIELPRLCDYNLYADVLYIFDNEKNKNHRFKGSYTLLGKPDEIKEEDVKDLVLEFKFGEYKLYNKPFYLTAKTAIKSFNSALESEIYWENPFKKPDNYHLWSKYGDYTQYGVGLTTDSLKWKEAQEKTFDRTRTLIFVEN